jgi:hypothetical protein
MFVILTCYRLHMSILFIVCCLQATSEEIPLIIRSCIRVINLYGLHHQGVFRVSGAQVEINHFKNIFESGMRFLPVCFLCVCVCVFFSVI